MHYEIEAKAGQTLLFNAVAEHIAEGAQHSVYFLTAQDYDKVKDDDAAFRPHWMPTYGYRAVTRDEPTASFTVPEDGVWHVLYRGPAESGPKFIIER